MKKITLTRGKEAIVDDDDFLDLSQFKWRAFHNRGKRWYAIRSDYSLRNRGKNLLMHRQLMNAPGHLQVDHINGDGLDNRRENLRLATLAENHMNSQKTRGASKYKGVTVGPRGKRWMAKISFEGKTEYIGLFDKEEDAALAYDREARLKFKDFARTNFAKEGLSI